MKGPWLSPEERGIRVLLSGNISADGEISLRLRG
jgi:hypothetical protein